MKLVPDLHDRQAVNLSQITLACVMGLSHLYTGISKEYAPLSVRCFMNCIFVPANKCSHVMTVFINLLSYCIFVVSCTAEMCFCGCFITKICRMAEREVRLTCKEMQPF